MSDRELLELAAKAAGIPCDKNGPYVERQEWQQWIGEPGHYETVRVNWNPITDDGDALRLAVKLGLVVCVMREARFTGVYLPAERLGGKYDEVQHHGDDADAATRRAIVRAAAQIGSGMK